MILWTCWKMKRPSSFNMKQIFTQLVVLFIAVSFSMAQEMRTFSNTKGEELTDRILKYNYEDRVVTLARSGRVSLDVFSKADQEYIFRWNQVNGFNMSMRFKISVQKKNWARMKHEQTITPFLMDAVQMPGKETPTHNVIMLDNYEEYTAVYFEAEGYEIILHNQNFFPLENLVVESKVFYEQEYYEVPDDILESSENEYDDVATTNRVRFVSETIPVIVTREKVNLYTDCAITIDHQIDRNGLVTTSEEGGDEGDGDGEDEDVSELPEEIVDGIGDIDDHNRRRQGKTIGVWVRVGLKGLDGKMIWRELTEPASLPKKVSWDSPTEKG